MKKSKKITPILTGTLLVLPSLLFLSSAQKSNAMLGNVLRGVTKLAASGPKLSTSGIGNIKVNTIKVTKANPYGYNKITGFSNVNYNSGKASTLPTGNTTSTSTARVNSNNLLSSNVTKRPLTTTTSNTSFEGVDPSQPIQVRLKQTLLANGIIPANPGKSGTNLSNSGKLTLKRTHSTASNASVTSNDSVDLSAVDKNLPIQQRLTHHLLKNGITPANPTKSGVGNTDLTRLSSSDV